MFKNLLKLKKIFKDIFTLLQHQQIILMLFRILSGHSGIKACFYGQWLLKESFYKILREGKLSPVKKYLLVYWCRVRMIEISFFIWVYLFSPVFWDQFYVFHVLCLLKNGPVQGIQFYNIVDKWNPASSLE